MMDIIEFYKKALRKWHIAALLTIIYFICVLTISYTIASASDSGLEDLLGSTDGTDDINESENVSQMFKMYEGKVIILSRQNNTNNIVSPTQKGGVMYPYFEIYMFANQPSYYLIKLDNQTYKMGHFVWWARVKAHTEYQTIDVEVILKNKTGVELPSFKFTNIHVIQYPSEEKPPSVVEPYVRMFTEGEVTMMLVKRVISDTILMFWGFLTGVGIAVIHADLRGVERVM